MSFKVRQGGISGLIGPNGAGKTTIFNLITGVYKVTAGQILFMGNPHPEPGALQDRLRIGVTRTFQNIRLFKDLSVFDNVFTACHLSARNTRLLESVLPAPPLLAGGEAHEGEGPRPAPDHGARRTLRTSRPNNLPYGLQRRLEITRALALDPKLLLLDEPAAGMNPDETEQLMRLIGEIRDKFNLSVLVIEHHMDLIMGICEHIHVLNFGCTLADGSADEVANDPKVVEAYLGAEEEEKAC